MNWPDDWTRGGASRQPGRTPDPDRERTRVMPGYAPGRPPYDEPEFDDPGEPLDEPPGPPRRPAGPARAPRRGVRGRGVRLGLTLFVLLLVISGTGLYFYADSHLHKVNALAGYAGRPAATPGKDWLIVGSDSREGLSKAERNRLRTGSAQGRRTDTIMLLHIGGSGATLVSLPRDSYVQIPAYVDERGRRHDAQRNKLNAAYSFGGPQLLARTVEQATDIRLDHYMEIGLGGFVGVVDSVGGVHMCLDKAIKDKDSGADLKAGCQELNGAQALSYVRARHFDARQDLGRVERQQQFLRSLTKEIATPGVLFNPFRFVPVMNSGLDAVTVDDGSGPFDLLRLFWNMRKLAGGDGVTTTVPVADPDYRPGRIGSTVRWDKAGAEALFGALRTDSRVSTPTKK